MDRTAHRTVTALGAAVLFAASALPAAPAAQTPPATAPATAPAPAPTAAPIDAPADAELAELARRLTGAFDTLRQVDEDERAGAPYAHMRVVLQVVPVEIAGVSTPDTRTFYLEQAAAATPAAPYRQRVIVLARDGGRLASRTFSLREPSALVGLGAKPELRAQLTAQRLIAEQGCDMTWIRVSPALFAGIAGLNRSCATAWRGAVNVVSQALLFEDSLISLDQGFDAAGAHVWGPPPGTIGHVFRKR